MLVEKLMQANPITVGPDDSFYHAMTLIRQQGFRHLPVVEFGQLVGIVTDRDLRQAAPSSATSLEAHELHYLLDKLTVREIMTPKVITVSPDTPLEEAARLMLRHRIRGLPVIRGGALAGILTDTDILRTIAEAMSLRDEQTRLELVLEDRPGAFLEVCRIIQGQGGDIASMVTATATHQGVEKRVVILRLDGVQLEPLVRDLEASGHVVLSAVV